MKKYEMYFKSPADSKLSFRIKGYSKKHPEYAFIYHPKTSSWYLIDWQNANKKPNANLNGWLGYATTYLDEILYKTDEWDRIYIDHREFYNPHGNDMIDEGSLPFTNLPELYSSRDLSISALAKIDINVNEESIVLVHNKKWLSKNIRFNLTRDKKN